MKILVSWLLFLGSLGCLGFAGSFLVVSWEKVVPAHDAYAAALCIAGFLYMGVALIIEAYKMGRKQ